MNFSKYERKYELYQWKSQLSCILFALLFGSLAYGRGNQYPATIVPPPPSFQTGDVFDGLTSLSQVFRNEIEVARPYWNARPNIRTSATTRPTLADSMMEYDHVFIVDRDDPSTHHNRFDPERLGPGTNVAVVTSEDGRFTAYSVTNGQFRGVRNQNDITSGYNDSISELKPGKYPWPTDSQGEYLPQNKVVSSAEGHFYLRNAIRRYQSYKGLDVTVEGKFVGGALGKNSQGKLYLGYVSKSVNGLTHLEGFVADTEIFAVDNRSAPRALRGALHDGITQSFLGEEVKTLVTSARDHKLKFRDRKSVGFFPDTISLGTPGAITDPKQLERQLVEQLFNAERSGKKLSPEQIRQLGLLKRGFNDLSSGRLALFDEQPEFVETLARNLDRASAQQIELILENENLPESVKAQIPKDLPAKMALLDKLSGC